MKYRKINFQRHPWGRDTIAIKHNVHPLLPLLLQDVEVQEVQPQIFFAEVTLAQTGELKYCSRSDDEIKKIVEGFCGMEQIKRSFVHSTSAEVPW